MLLRSILQIHSKSKILEKEYCKQGYWREHSLVVLNATVVVKYSADEEYTDIVQLVPFLFFDRTPTYIIEIKSAILVL